MIESGTVCGPLTKNATWGTQSRTMMQGGGIHTGFSTKGGDRGQGGVSSNCRVAFFRDFIDLDDKQGTHLQGEGTHYDAGGGYTL